jgi:hypothetical protein
MRVRHAVVVPTPIAPSPARPAYRAELQRELRALKDNIAAVQQGITLETAQAALQELPAPIVRWVDFVREHGDENDMHRLCGNLMELRRALQRAVFDKRANNED